ncbi:uncharacterized protein LOC122234729 [Panthera tigris]|uniref:uncharacterized protein LOC122234729 n=1 Tax=Panthera tigris TaxID=9694 RepID=UPI001C6F73FC|nr:uncharacterized protein LOC122234729 [Panthera tigris]XP_042828187.1 uncharacterized protein LOC122234729 [Panthera tigris]XP_042828188.1 uncharacterized protein LOC122234729 [Panthera tigris]
MSPARSPWGQDRLCSGILEELQFRHRQWFPAFSTTPRPWSFISQKSIPELPGGPASNQPSVSNNKHVMSRPLQQACYLEDIQILEIIHIGGKTTTSQTQESIVSKMRDLRLAREAEDEPPHPHSPVCSLGCHGEAQVGTGGISWNACQESSASGPAPGRGAASCGPAGVAPEENLLECFHPHAQAVNQRGLAHGQICSRAQPLGDMAFAPRPGEELPFWPSSHLRFSLLLFRPHTTMLQRHFL